MQQTHIMRLAGDLEREPTALRQWAATYRFNLLRGLLAGRLIEDSTVLAGATAWPTARAP